MADVEEEIREEAYYEDSTSAAKIAERDKTPFQFQNLPPPTPREPYYKAGQYIYPTYFPPVPFASSVDAIPLPPPAQSGPVFHYTPREVRMLMEISRLRAENMFSPLFS